MRLAMNSIEPAVLFLVLLLTISLAGASVAQTLHFIRPVTVSGGGHHHHHHHHHQHHSKGLSCESWRLGVETDNVREWATVPEKCGGYVGHYMLGGRYRQDSLVVSLAAVQYANNHGLTGDDKEVWVFGIDEATLSNLPYYARHGFGTETYNATSFNAWVETGMAPPLPESLALYNKLVSLGIKIVFLTNRKECYRKITTYNLKRSGYHTWETLILQKPGYNGSAMEYKSAERQNLVNEGYRIVGNTGDQWSDILGEPEGDRTFKLPDPMYYIA